MVTHNIVANEIPYYMRQPRISISFSGYSDADFETKAEHIVASITGNPAFPNPTPSLEDVQAAVTAYSTALVAAADLGRKNIAAKNKARQQVEALLKPLGNYVMCMANGDYETLVTSGFSLTKGYTPRHLGATGNVTIANGNTSGAMVASVKTVSGASSYKHDITEQAPAENTVWESTVTTRSKFTYHNLTPGKQYWVRVAAIGTDGQVSYSPVSTQFAQ
jgi:hypothetical protein